MGMSIRDLVFSPLYPYRYTYPKSDETCEIIFSKEPMIVPDMIERAKLQKIISENKPLKDKYVYYDFILNKLRGEDNE